jgi:hypothetical protein
MKNIGRVERIIRIIVGLALLSLLFLLQGNLKYVGLIGFVPLITGIIGFCPIYALIWINTNKTKK